MSLIVCKKCGGPHITLKCGKEPKPVEIKTYNEPTYMSKKNIVTVRLSNLPEDITQYELEKLMKEWGSISRVNLNNFENKSGFIDFYIKSEADYFIEAVDRTPFDNLILRAEYIENKY